MERWQHIVTAACEQSHRSRIPDLRAPLPFEALLAWEAPQKWVAYELRTGEASPTLRRETLAFTHGPEESITDPEIRRPARAGWAPVSLGASILRAVTCPAAIPRQRRAVRAGPMKQRFERANIPQTSYLWRLTATISPSPLSTPRKPSGGPAHWFSATSAGRGHRVQPDGRTTAPWPWCRSPPTTRPGSWIPSPWAS